MASGRAPSKPNTTPVISSGSHAGVAPVSVANTTSWPASRSSFHGTATSVTSKSLSGSGSRIFMGLLFRRQDREDDADRAGLHRDVLIRIVKHDVGVLRELEDLRDFLLLALVADALLRRDRADLDVALLGLHFEGASRRDLAARCALALRADGIDVDRFDHA